MYIQCYIIYHLATTYPVRDLEQGNYRMFTSCMLYFCLCIGILSYSCGLSLGSNFPHSNLQRFTQQSGNNDAASSLYFRQTTSRSTKVTFTRNSISSIFELRSGNSLLSLSNIALANPQSLFNVLLVSLAALAVIGKTATSVNRNGSEDSDKKPPAVRSLQIKFLGNVLFL